ncbi:MAG: hypothetical protein ACKKL5_03530 [Candidatus Komeilibacteria bacterium]
MTSLYRNIIARSWEMVKKYKFFWLLGLFAMFFGTVAEYKSLFVELSRLSNQPNVYDAIARTITIYGTAWQAIWQLPLANLLAVLLTILLGILLVIVMAWLATVSQVTIIQAADDIREDKSFKWPRLLQNSHKFFWRAFGLNLLAKVIIFILLTLLITPLLTILVANGSAWALPMTIITLVIFVPLTIILSFVTKYAINFVVLEKHKFWESFGHGWRLFAQHWLISIEMAIIALIVYIALAFIMSLASLLLASPLLVIGMLSGNSQLFYIFLGAALVISAAIFLFGSAVFTAWQNVAWTLLFRKLQSGQVFAKIVRWVAARAVKKSQAKL